MLISLRTRPLSWRGDVSIVELVRGKCNLDRLQSKCVHITSWKCLIDSWSHFYLINEQKWSFRSYSIHNIVPQLKKEQKLAHEHTHSCYGGVDALMPSPISTCTVVVVESELSTTWTLQRHWNVYLMLPACQNGKVALVRMVTNLILHNVIDLDPRCMFRISEFRFRLQEILLGRTSPSL